MGNQFIWQDRFNIGVDVIDREHKKLFSIMNRLFIFSEQEDKIQWVCEEGLKYFTPCNEAFCRGRGLYGFYFLYGI